MVPSPQAFRQLVYPSAVALIGHVALFVLGRSIANAGPIAPAMASSIHKTLF